VTAFLARHYGGHENDGSEMQLPMFTVTARDHHAVVASHLLKLRGGFADHQVTAGAWTDPAPTLTAGGTHLAEVRAFLIKYYGTEQDPQLRFPLHTLTTKHRFGLVTVQGDDYAIADIGMRMLVPRELFRAQGFPDSYRIEQVANGLTLTKTAQVRMCGNSVNPDIAEALVTAQFAAVAVPTAEVAV
jgi:DNA (cytosine-5)-methyltransferase 1